MGDLFRTETRVGIFLKQQHIMAMLHLRSMQRVQAGACARRASVPARCPLRVNNNSAPTAATTSQSFSSSVTVRPYTLRKDDTLATIAQKRDMSVDDLLAINPDINIKQDLLGKTILLPANKLSKRDKEILGGIGQGYRVYPVRAGETLADVITKRSITRSEMEALNPGVNLDALTANQLLKLPTNKFTVREREMLIGSKVLPPEFFQAASNPFVVGLGALMMVCGFVLAWQRFHADGDFNAEE